MDSTLCSNKLPEDTQMEFYEALIQNSIEMKNRVSSEHATIFKSLTSSSVVPADIQTKLLTIDQARLTLYENIFDFMAMTSQSVHSQMSDSQKLQLLKYIPGTTGRNPLGSFNKCPYQGRISSERISPDRISPDRISPDRISPDRISPDKMQLSEHNDPINAVPIPVPCSKTSKSSYPAKDFNESLVRDGSPETRDNFTRTGSESETESLYLSLSPSTIEMYDDNNKPATNSSKKVNDGDTEGLVNNQDGEPPSEPPLSLQSLTMESLPESVTSFESLQIHNSHFSAESLNLQGPLVAESVQLFPSEFPRFADISCHSCGYMICTGKRGLWFRARSTTKWRIVSENAHISICAHFKGKEAFTVSGEKGDPWVKKFDLWTGSPIEVGRNGFFEVLGGKWLIAITLSPTGLLAVADYESCIVTVHEQTGARLHNLVGYFEGGGPVRLSWLPGQRLVAKSWGGTKMHQWVSCIELPGDIGGLHHESEGMSTLASSPTTKAEKMLWKSCRLPHAWAISAVESRVYVAIYGSSSFTVLDAATGNALPEERLLATGEQSFHLMKIDDTLTIVSYKRTKGK